MTGTPAEAATTSTTAAVPVPTLTPRNVCEAEAFKVFPVQYHEEVRITLQRENGKGLPGLRIANSDKESSHDHGCFMINDYWQLAKPSHPNPPSRWLSYDAIFDPNYNARVAYNIFKSQNNTWGAWYGPCHPGKEVLPKSTLR